ncbi:NAD(P)-dependent oxidoreductase [Devosia yakushimensis]|uniref:dTDP-4-dehydrorhamnose reductase n=1 Tax=Devosia yakushimensis TaxID=470028 RepID=A0ABQ5UI04_9HYPH|nr:dTDP-4-dehydrorhamnose reductase [Devosia yakushimensis]GLQ11248.1 NAD(P)-dependent oxidoreductase [Devosia yakushimensis]
MKILVTGTEGQVVTALRHRCAECGDLDLVTVGRPELDLSKPEDIAETIVSHRPDIVVSAAAWTAVDLAEDEPDLAMRINGEGAGQVARGAALVGAPVIHLSTDYVYDGLKPAAWTEDDAVNPLSVYGRSKLAGERRVIEENPRHVILRTAWVYSPFGKNFVRTMLQLAQTREELTIVDDQYGCPTSAFDLADGVLAVVQKLSAPSAADDNVWGVYHLTGTGTATWCDLAREVYRQSRGLNLPSARVKPVGTDAFPTKAVRPRNSRLDCSKLESVFGFRCPPWSVSLEECLKEIARENGGP